MIDDILPIALLGVAATMVITAITLAIYNAIA